MLIFSLRQLRESQTGQFWGFTEWILDFWPHPAQSTTTTTATQNPGSAVFDIGLAQRCLFLNLKLQYRKLQYNLKLQTD